jgi:hypothetical protein
LSASIPAQLLARQNNGFPSALLRLPIRLNKRFGSKTIIFGGPNDRELGADIMKMMKTFAVDLSGKTTLKEAMALIARCRLFITNDSGLMHIAAALNVAQVAIFGSTNFAATSPWSPRARIVRSALDCSPCLKQQCPFGHRECMKKISVDKVFKTACNFNLTAIKRRSMKKTKIIATISNKSCSVDLLEQMYHAGMDVVRLNTAHQSLEDALPVIENIRAVSDRIAIMIDTKGLKSVPWR